MLKPKSSGKCIGIHDEKQEICNVIGNQFDIRETKQHMPLAENFKLSSMDNQKQRIALLPSL